MAVQKVQGSALAGPQWRQKDFSYVFCLEDHDCDEHRDMFSIIQAPRFYFKCTVLIKPDSLPEILLTGTGLLWRKKNCKSFQRLLAFAGRKESGVCETGSCKCRVCQVSLCIPVRTRHFEEMNSLLGMCSQSWSVCAVCRACPYLYLVNQTYHSHIPRLP